MIADVWVVGYDEVLGALARLEAQRPRTVPRDREPSVAYMVMAYMVMAYIVMAYEVVAYVVMAYTVMADIVMAYIVMAYICRMRD